MIGAMGGMLACIGVCVDNGMGAGFNTFLACSVVGGGLGAAIGYFRGRHKAANG